MTEHTNETIPTRLGRLHAVLTAGGYQHDNEKQLQDQIEAKLRKAGIRYQRETRLGDTGTPDFLVGKRPWIVLEVKVGGSKGQLLEQVDRYLSHGYTGACLIATSRASHRDVPQTLRHKRLRVAWLSAGAAFGATREGAALVPTVGQLVRTTKGWAATLEPHAMARFKRIFSRIGGKQYGTVQLDGRRETCRDLLWFTSRFPLQMSELDRLHLSVQAQKYDDQRTRMCAIADGEFSARDFQMALPPRIYQAQAAEMALQAGGLLVADQLGLGKTVTAITALTDATTRPALVVTLTHLPGQWADELKRFAPGLKVHVITKGKPYDVTRKKGDRKVNGDAFRGPDMVADFPDVLITSYTKLAGWADTLAPIINGVVYDEIQELRKGSDTAKGKAAYHLSRNADVLRMGLSASPIYNYGDEVHAVVEALTPGALGTQSEFITEWCSAAGDRNHRVRDPAALGSWLRAEGIMIRRSRSDVGRELPPLHHVPVLVEVNQSHLDKVSAEVRALAQAVLSKDTDSKKRGLAAMDLDLKMRQATGIAKAPYVAAHVEQLLNDGAQQVVLAGWHRNVYRIWQDLLGDYGIAMYTGSENTKKKDKAKADFVAGRARILMISLRSGAGLDGLQYTACQDAVIGEFDWSPKVQDQLLGRLHRDGQGKPVTAWFPYSDQGSDPLIMDMLGIKNAQSAGILDPTGQQVVAAPDVARGRALARRILGMA